MNFIKVETHVRHYSKSKTQTVCCLSCGAPQRPGRPSKHREDGFAGLSAVALMQYAQKRIVVDISAKFCLNCAADIDEDELRKMYDKCCSLVTQLMSNTFYVQSHAFIV